MSIKFKTTDEERKQFDQIVARAMVLGVKLDVKGLDAEDLAMSLVACHLNGCPLDLAKLLAAPDGSFGHDVFGIRRYLDRITGRLSPQFLPRCHLQDRSLPIKFSADGKRFHIGGDVIEQTDDGVRIRRAPRARDE